MRNYDRDINLFGEDEEILEENISGKILENSGISIIYILLCP